MAAERLIGSSHTPSVLATPQPDAVAATPTAAVTFSDKAAIPVANGGLSAMGGVMIKVLLRNFFRCNL